MNVSDLEAKKGDENYYSRAVTVDFWFSDAGIKNFVEVKLSDVVLAESLRSMHGELTFFDSLHAAVAKRVDLAMLSSDPIYRKIGLKTLNFEDFS